MYDKKRELKLDTKVAGTTLNKTLREAQKEFNKTGKHSEEMKDKIRQAVAQKVSLQFSTDKANSDIKEFEKHISKVKSDMKDLKNQKAKPSVSVDDKASKVLDSIGGKMKSIAKGVTVGGLAVAGAAAAGAGAGIYQALNVSGRMEQTEKAFGTMLKSQAAGSKMMGDLSKFAVATPYEFEDLAKNTQFALAMGFEKDDVLGLLTDVGDASAGLSKGAEGIESMIRALGQMKAKGKVSAEEVNQLAENGVKAWDYIARSIHKTTAETMKLGEKGLLPAEKAIQAIRKGMREDYGGMMGEQSKTLLGLLSSVKDFATLNVFKTFGDGIRIGIQPQLQKFVDMLSNSPEKLERFQKKLTDIGKTMGEFVSKKTDELYNYFQKLFNDPEFEKADLGGKIKIVLNKAAENIKDWFRNDGSDVISAGTRQLINLLVATIKGSMTVITPVMIEVGAGLGKGMLEGFKGAMTDQVLGDVIEEKHGKNFKMGITTTLPDLLNHARWYQNNKNATQKSWNEIEHNLPGKAFGMSRVPYNDYPVRLHEGEKVLTKQEANQQANKSNVTIEKLADQIIVREEADIEKIVAALANRLHQASQNYGGAY